MPRFNVKAPDGTVIPVDAPEGATEKQAIAFAASTWKPKVTAEVAPQEAVQAAETPADSRTPWEKASVGDIVAGLGLTRGLVGAASPVIGALQVGVNVGDWLSQKMGSDPVLGKYLAEKIGEYEAAKQRGMAALGREGTDYIGWLSSLATGTVALRGVAPAASYFGKVAQGAATGWAAGATTPSSTPGIEQTGEQALTGAVLGGSLPAVAPALAKVGKTAYRTVIEPWLNPTAVKQRAYSEAAGPKAQEILNALRDPAQEIVPGSLPTAGQAAVPAGRTEWAALQKSAEKILPSEYLTQADVRNVARVNQLRTVGKSKAELAAAENEREANALANYAAANAAGVDLQAAAALRPQITTLMARPAMQDAKQIASRIAADSDLPAVNFGSVEGLDLLKKALDKQIATVSKQNTALGASDLKSLMQTKTDLLGLIKQVAPAYDIARAEYAAQSLPINQMRVGQYLENKLVPALGEDAKQKAATFAAALQDAPGTLRRALTGSPRYEELTQVLTPAQKAAVDSVKRDLAREARFEEMARLGGAAGTDAAGVATQSVHAASGGATIPNPLSRVVTVANAILGRLEGKINKKLAMEIATEMLSPTKTANQLEAAMVRKARQDSIKNALNSGRVPVAVGAGQLSASLQNSEE